MTQRLTPQQWTAVISEVTRLWGGNKWNNAHHVYDKVRTIPYVAFEKAINEAFDQGESYAPGIPELSAKARRIAGGDTFDAASCQHPYWAILDELEDGRRLGLCAVCRVHEATFGRGLLSTASERESQAVPV